MVIISRTHKTITNSTQERLFDARNIPLLTSHTIVAVENSPEQIAQKLGLDSLVYQPLDGLIASIGIPSDNLCLACLTGNYPTPKGNELVTEAWENYKAGIKKRTYG